MTQVSNTPSERLSEIKYDLTKPVQSQFIREDVRWLVAQVESLQVQLDRVDDALEWKGTGEGRVSMALSGKVAQTQLRDLWVRELYTEEDAVIWIADAESKGHSIVKQLQRLDQLRTGAFA